MGSVLLAFALFISTAWCLVEILKNPSFETTEHWDCFNIQCSVTDMHIGRAKGVNVTERHNFYDGPSQVVQVREQHTYRFEGWAVLLNDDNKNQNVQLVVEYNLKNGHKTFKTVAERSDVRTSTGWIHLKGTFETPGNLDHIRVHIQGPDPGIDFVVDGATLVDPSVTPAVIELQYMNQQIDRVRKRNIHYKVTTDSGVDPGTVTIETVMTNHTFPFGTAVSASIINRDNGGSDEKYRQFIYDNFNWAVVENALTWRHLEPTEGHPDYDTVINAVKRLRSHGMKVRGHNLLWAREMFVPEWLRTKSPSEVRSIVDRHVHELVGRLKGLVDHWDVNDEMLHGNWYAAKLNDSDFTKGLFKTVHSLHPNATLFLNEYGAITTGAITIPYYNQVLDYKTSGTHLGGIGVQCHLGKDLGPVPYMLNYHMKELVKADLPIWITAFDVQSDDEKTRSQYYDRALRFFFSHESIEGIMLWGFWSEHHWRGEAAALVSGPEFRVNAAGQKFLDLVHKEWKTYDSHELSQSSTFTVRGFRGKYNVNVNINGHTVQTQHFTLGDTDQTVNLHVSKH